MTTQYLTTLRSYLLKTVNLIHPRWSLLAGSVWWVCQQLEAITQEVGSLAAITGSNNACRCGLGHGLIQGSGPHGAINLEAQTIQFFLNSVTP